MSDKGKETVKNNGLYYLDEDDIPATTLVDKKECCFVYFDESNSAKCSIETAYKSGDISFNKPQSCHLYPIRIKELQDFSALNVHQWPICDAARSCGAASQINVLDFCKTALVRRFGEDWYEEAKLVCDAWQKQQNRP